MMKRMAVGVLACGIALGGAATATAAGGVTSPWTSTGYSGSQGCNVARNALVIANPQSDVKTPCQLGSDGLWRFRVLAR